MILYCTGWCKGGVSSTSSKKYELFESVVDAAYLRSTSFVLALLFTIHRTSTGSALILKINISICHIARS